MILLICSIATLIICSVAAILFLWAHKLSRKLDAIKSQCTSCATATVVAADEVCTRNVDTYNYTWFPVYSFSVGDETVRARGVIGVSQSTFQVGQEVEVFYNPEDYRVVYSLAEARTTPVTVLKCIAVLFTLCGALSAVIGYLISTNLLK